MNNDWEFIPEFTEEFLTDNSQIKTEKVRIPHTTKEVPYNYFDESMYQMLCGYRKIFTAPSEWKDKRIILKGVILWTFYNLLSKKQKLAKKP